MTINVGVVGFEPTEFLMYWIYSPAPIHLLSSTPEYSETFIDQCVYQFHHTITSSETRTRNIIMLYSVFNYLLSRLERKEAALIARCKEIENEILTKKELDKQMTFSAPEILDITSRLKIRGKTSKNTVYSHLSKGLLKGTQNDLGNWTVKREDLEKYLNRTDF